MNIYKLDNIKLSPTSDERELVKIAARALGHKPLYFRILKKSLDARKKQDIHWVFSIEYGDEFPPVCAPLEKLRSQRKVYVVGSGPAGLLCAVRLADRGFTPIVVERGERVDDRAESVQKFFGGGELDENSNVQFGEGGAGTFSDGKLNTQTHSGFNAEVYRTFVRFGAPEDTLYLNKPHIGSDVLKNVVKNMREYIISCGGQVRFGTLFSGFASRGGKLFAVRLKTLDNGFETEEAADDLVIATGHSARDTFAMLTESGLAAEAREFAVGVRIEHAQDCINRAQYGNVKGLPAADYKAVSTVSDRRVFTFCMCPGGYVMAAASERGGVVTNGMSNRARDGVNANSALMVQVRFSDFPHDGITAGIEYQRAIERKAFALGGGNYRAPVQTVGDFLKGGDGGSIGSVAPTYPRGISFVPLTELFPRYVTDPLKAAIRDIGKRIRGFDAPDGILTAAETRFTSPLRFIRDDTLQSASVRGIYPCGEGSGYSGGITSSAADGLRVAEALYEKYRI